MFFCIISDVSGVSFLPLIWEENISFLFQEDHYPSMNNVFTLVCPMHLKALKINTPLFNYWLLFPFGAFHLSKIYILFEYRHNILLNDLNIILYFRVLFSLSLSFSVHSLILSSFLLPFICHSLLGKSCQQLSI